MNITKTKPFLFTLLWLLTISFALPIGGVVADDDEIPHVKLITPGSFVHTKQDTLTAGGYPPLENWRTNCGIPDPLNLQLEVELKITKRVNADGSLADEPWTSDRLQEGDEYEIHAKLKNLHSPGSPCHPTDPAWGTSSNFFGHFLIERVDPDNSSNDPLNQTGWSGATEETPTDFLGAMAEELLVAPKEGEGPLTFSMDDLDLINGVPSIQFLVTAGPLWSLGVPSGSTPEPAKVGIDVHILYQCINPVFCPPFPVCGDEEVGHFSAFSPPAELAGKHRTTDFVNDGTASGCSTCSGAGSERWNSRPKTGYHSFDDAVQSRRRKQLNAWDVL